jgi:hypothetical protein
MPPKTRETAKRLIPAVLAYFGFLIPFIINANYPLDAALSIGVISKYPQSLDNQRLLSAALIGLPYFGLAWTWYVLLRPIGNRLTMRYRINQLKADIDSILSSKDSSAIYYDSLRSYYRAIDINTKHSHEVEALQNGSSALLINTLMVDVKIAMERLCNYSGIRVSVYMEGSDIDDYGNFVRGNVLVKQYTNEYADQNGQSISFPIRTKENYRDWQASYCGLCWDTGLPRSGTPHPFLFVKDRNFHPGTDEDEKRSYLCLPITKNQFGVQVPVAVISIDSLRKYDFFLFNGLRRKIDDTMYPVKIRLREYLDIIPDSESH